MVGDNQVFLAHVEDMAATAAAAISCFDSLLVLLLLVVVVVPAAAADVVVDDGEQVPARTPPEVHRRRTAVFQHIDQKLQLSLSLFAGPPLTPIAQIISEIFD